MSFGHGNKLLADGTIYKADHSHVLMNEAPADLDGRRPGKGGYFPLARNPGVGNAPIVSAQPSRFRGRLGMRLT
jgi:hypothetical protein